MESGKQKSNGAQALLAEFFALDELKAPAADALSEGKSDYVTRMATITDADLLLGVSLLLFKKKGRINFCIPKITARERNNRYERKQKTAERSFKRYSP